ncbi:Septum formation protein Maf [Candidatus Syntrophocurvum alkaliphilum]|uniref:dTTP/UTP pyrophosphatase n=1 Tax=Candidatus Syntrophocurvum alkaliphilum TaxID=2293317 RepID=A0A6I6DIH0_9FIRM|nr:Maf family protein [Candidatus Syntrophocurvum alkaliphilum]QGU00051.1 Septum formation protein Maf [Candidatus Syntrophocurvum alkaliphilum]
MPRIILASQSPRRKELLIKIGLEFEVIPAGINEEGLTANSPDELVQKLAILKGRHIANKVESGIIISADTIVVLNGQILGKPFNRDSAKAMLKTLSNNIHEVQTGLCLINKDLDNELVIVEKTMVHFKSLTNEEIDFYIKTGEPMDKAGAYGIQGFASVFIKKIEGCYFNVVGLPLHRLYELLISQGVNLMGGEGRVNGLQSYYKGHARGHEA